MLVHQGCCGFRNSVHHLKTQTTIQAKKWCRNAKNITSSYIFRVRRNRLVRFWMNFSLNYVSKKTVTLFQQDPSHFKYSLKRYNQHINWQLTVLVCCKLRRAVVFFPPDICHTNRSVKMCISSVVECDAKCCKCQSICEYVTSSRSVAVWLWKQSWVQILKARHASGTMLNLQQSTQQTPHSLPI